MEELDRRIEIDPTEGDSTYRELTVSTGAEPIAPDVLEEIMQVVAPGRPTRVGVGRTT